jgi:hypothetical protein
MKTNIKDFFKNIRNEYCVYSDLVKNREEIKSKHSSELLKLNVKKEKLWTGKDFSKWELNENEKVDKSLLNKDRTYAFSRMFHKETSYLNNLNNKLGYYNKMVIDELRRLINSHVTRYTEQIKNFSEEFYPSLTDVKKIKYFLLLELNKFYAFFILSFFVLVFSLLFTSTFFYLLKFLIEFLFFSLLFKFFILILNFFRVLMYGLI